MIPLSRILRQKRRLAVLAFGGLLAIFATVGPAFGVLAFLALLGAGGAVVARAPQHRTWLETVGIGLTLAVFFAMLLPFSPWITLPALSAVMIAAIRVALYGNWAEKFDFWLPLTLRQTRQVNQPPKAVWAAAAPGGGEPDEVFPGSVEEVFVDADDPETIYVVHFDGREDTITFLRRQAPQETQYLRMRDGTAREALVDLRISEFTLGQSFVTMEVSFDSLLPKEIFRRFFDDALGDEMDSLAAWLEDRDDHSLFALDYTKGPVSHHSFENESIAAE